MSEAQSIELEDKKGLLKKLSPKIDELRRSL